MSLVVNGQNSDSCFSLANSKQCPEYKDYSIVAAKNSFSDAASFDSYMAARNGWFYSKCPTFKPLQSNIRYANSFVCAFAVQASTQGLPEGKCNSGLPPPPRVCKSSLSAAIADVSAILKSQCSSQTIFPSYSAFINSAQQSDKNCILSSGNEVGVKCGIKNPADAAKYCTTNKSALCCTATSNSLLDNPVNPVNTINSTLSTTNSNTTIESTTTVDTSLAAATQDSSNSSTSSGGISPLLIGAAAVGCALAILLIAVLFFMRRKSNLKKVENMENRSSGVPLGATVPSNDTMECVFEYSANLFDELTLSVGDEVQVLNKYDDGWALGNN